MDAIRTDALTKHYSVGFWRPRPYLALESLTLSVGLGEVFGFLGPNGAGKTTTLKLLMQLIYPTSGTAQILGQPVGSADVKRRIGYLPENPYFYDHLTAEELLEYFGSLFGYDAAERRKRATRLLDEVGIGAERRLQLRKFSKGMLQRVGIAQAHAEALCSRVAVVAKGRLVAEGPLTQILAFKVHGWELVMSHVPMPTIECALKDGRITKALPLGEDRYALDLPLETAPDKLMADLTNAGAKLVSLNPLRETLEDFFVRQVAGARTDRGLE
jgi:ABC-2 type transport system ATP-binding protein